MQTECLQDSVYPLHVNAAEESCTFSVYNGGHHTETHVSRYFRMENNFSASPSGIAVSIPSPFLNTFKNEETA